MGYKKKQRYKKILRAKKLRKILLRLRNKKHRPYKNILTPYMIPFGFFTDTVKMIPLQPNAYISNTPHIPSSTLTNDYYPTDATITANVYSREAYIRNSLIYSN